MDAGSRASADAERTDVSERSGRPEVDAHCTRPGRFVFTESGNPNGWVATSLTVALDP